MIFIAFALSFVSLILGADLAIDGSEKIGKKLKLSPLVIGVLFLGIGTSLPELFVTHFASFKGSFEIAIGNVLGSNIANIGLILGISCLLIKFNLKQAKIQRQFLLHLFMTLTAYFIILLTHKIDFIFLVLLMVFFVTYMYLIIKSEKNFHVEETLENFRWKNNILKSLFGFILLYFGGKYLIFSVEEISKIFNINTYIISSIGLAFGTSFPELITALLAIKKKKNQNLIIGNVIGSNVFNLSLILATSGVYNYDVGRPLDVEFLVLLLFSLGLVFFSYMIYYISKVFGVVSMIVYFAVVYYWISL